MKKINYCESEKNVSGLNIVFVKKNSVDIFDVLKLL